MDVRPESPLGSADVRGVPRYAHGSRVPGWDRAADLEKDPAAVPDPNTSPGRSVRLREA